MASELPHDHEPISDNLLPFQPLQCMQYHDYIHTIYITFKSNLGWSDLTHNGIDAHTWVIMKYYNIVMLSFMVKKYY